MNSNDIQRRLGENLKRIRKQRHLTQFQLAEKAGVSEETVKNIELSRCWTSDKNLSKITYALDIDVLHLFMPVSSSLAHDKDIILQIKKAVSEHIREYAETLLQEFEKE